MTARSTAYAPVRSPTQAAQAAKLGDSDLFFIIEGTAAEIQATAPSGRALGFPNDSPGLWKYHPTAVPTWQNGGSSSPATATTLGGVIVPASGGLAVDGSGNLKINGGGIIIPGGAQVPDLLVGATWTAGVYISDTGTVVAQGGYAASGYIAVTPGDILMFHLGTTLTLPGSFYGVSYAFVAKIKASAYNSGFGGNGPSIVATVPTGVAFMRVTLQQAGTDWYGQGWVRKFTADTFTPVRTIKSITGIGDSIAAGYQLVSQFPWWKKFGIMAGATIQTNLGINSTTVARNGSSNPMVDRLSAIPNSDIVVFEGGYNDWAQSVTLGTPASVDPTTFYGALNLIAIFMQRSFGLVYPIWYKSIKQQQAVSGATNSLSLKMDDYMAAFDVVAKNYGIKIVDHYNRFSYGPGSNNAMLADGLHQSDYGSIVCANAMYTDIFH